MHEFFLFIWTKNWNVWNAAATERKTNEWNWIRKNKMKFDAIGQCWNYVSECENKNKNKKFQNEMKINNNWKYSDNNRW